MTIRGHQKKIIVQDEVRKEVVSGKTCQHLKDSHSVVVVLTLVQRHKSGEIDDLTHL